MVGNDVRENGAIQDIDITHRLGKRKLNNNCPWPKAVKCLYINI